MHNKELKRLKELCDAATPGPWSNKSRWHGKWGVVADETHELGEFTVASMNSNFPDPAQANSDFIAEARTAMPALLDEVERLKKFETYASESKRVREILVENVRLTAEVERLTHSVKNPGCDATCKNYCLHVECPDGYHDVLKASAQVDLLLENARLREAIEKTIARADDYADSWISKPVREALKEKS